MILSAISVGYTAFAANRIVAAVLKGMQAGVAALIVDVVADMFAVVLKEKSWLLILIVPFSFAACFVFNINVAAVSYTHLDVYKRQAFEYGYNL